MEDNRLLNGIIEKADADAEEIIRKAHKTVAEKNQAYEAAVERIRKETDSRIAEKIAEIEIRTESAVKSEKRRAALKNRGKANSEVREIFFKKISNMIGSPEYDDFLSKLIAEGAVSVNDGEAVVSCSFKEKITDSILEEAGKYIKNYTGKQIILKRSEADDLGKQGIMVESSNRRIAYNNQIESRLRRFDEDIKMIILKGLEKE